MNKNIPIYSIKNLSNQEEEVVDVFLLFNQKVDSPQSVHIPYRSNYYGLGICIQGKAELKANLEAYPVEPNCLIIMSPHFIKQWTFMSEDFETYAIFFTKDFIATNNHLSLDNFSFFESMATHVFPVSAQQSEIIVSSLNFLRHKQDTPRPYRNEILKNGINILLYEMAAIYNQQSFSTTVPTRSQLLASDFKKLAAIHFTTERSVKFYADNLFVTPKHLTEIVKEMTGKTAGEWIDETVILEAKVLLQNPALSIAQISGMLHFSDQSTFGKFFKNITGLSPVSYKKSL